MKPRKILLVEDEPDISEVFKKLLEVNDYQVVTAHDGVEGFNKAKEEKPDLMLLDLKMPNKDGFTTLRELKNNDLTRGITVVMLTVSGDLPTIRECINLGAKDYFMKSWEPQLFLKYIRKYTI